MKIFKKIFRHKFILFLVIVVLAGGGYFLDKKLAKTDSVTRYVLSQVEPGTIESSVSGTGQVETVEQQNIMSKVDGNITYLGVQEGQTVSAGQVLAKIDTTDAQNAIENAQSTLNQAELNLQQMQGEQTSTSSIRGITEKAQDTLNNDYSSSYNNLSSIYLSLPNIMSEFHDILFSNDFTPTQENIDYYANPILAYSAPGASDYRNSAYNSYQTAKSSYDASLSDYQQVNSFSSQTTIDSMLSETYQTLKVITDALKDTNNLINFYQTTLDNKNLTPQTLAATQLSSINTYIGQVNGYISTVSSDQNSIQSDKEALAQTTTTIASQEQVVANDQSALSDAQSKLADYTITAPYSGVISSLSIKNGDPVTSGENLMTLVSDQNVVSITLNEVDIASVKVGQQVTLTFDALPNLDVAGTVSEVDAVGTVSQGVVDYGVTISLDTQDSQLRPGMSVTADIITDVKQNVLVVPTSAIHSQGSSQYVEVPSSTSSLNLASAANSASGIVLDSPPTEQVVQTGVSDNTNTEITSGLSAGQYIITSTITPSTQSSSQSSSQSRSILQSGGSTRSTGGGRAFFLGG